MATAYPDWYAEEGAQMRNTKRNAIIAVGAIAVGLAVGPAAVSHVRGSLLRSGVEGSLPTDPMLAGAAAGGRPWVADRHSSVRVDRDGDVRIKVRGLVIPDAPFNGTNPVPALSASLVCGGVIVAETVTVPFDTAGNAKIRDEITVPERCLAPAVLLHPGGNDAVYIGTSG